MLNLTISVIFSAFQCGSYQMTLSCPSASTILVSDAVYGQYGYTSSQEDLLCFPPNLKLDCIEEMETSVPGDWLLLQSLCDGQTECSFLTKFGLMTTCGESQVSEYALVHYECVPSEYHTLKYT